MDCCTLVSIISADLKCPTDSRKRPDQRLLEGGKVCLVGVYWLVCDVVLLQIDEASEEKHRLEEKQRASRKQREKKGEDWRPM